MYFIFSLLAFGVVLDILTYFYKCNYKVLNYFLVIVMTYGHPLYFGLTYFGIIVIALILRLILTIVAPETNFFNTEIEAIISYIIFMPIFAVLRYKFHESVWGSKLNLYEFSKFYFFTIVFIPIYYNMFRENNFETYTIATMSLIPILSVLAIIYSAIKFFIIKSIQRRQDV